MYEEYSCHPKDGFYNLSKLNAFVDSSWRWKTKFPPERVPSGLNSQSDEVIKGSIGDLSPTRNRRSETRTIICGERSCKTNKLQLLYFSSSANRFFRPVQSAKASSKWRRRNTYSDMYKDELIKLVSSKTGLNQEMATLAVDIVIGFLKQKASAWTLWTIGFLAIRSRVLLRNTGCGKRAFREER